MGVFPLRTPPEDLQVTNAIPKGRVSVQPLLSPGLLHAAADSASLLRRPVRPSDLIWNRTPLPWFFPRLPHLRRQHSLSLRGSGQNPSMFPSAATHLCLQNRPSVQPFVRGSQRPLLHTASYRSCEQLPKAACLSAPCPPGLLLLPPQPAHLCSTWRSGRASSGVIFYKS